LTENSLNSHRPCEHFDAPRPLASTGQRSDQDNSRSQQITRDLAKGSTPIVTRGRPSTVLMPQSKIAKNIPTLKGAASSCGSAMFVNMLHERPRSKGSVDRQSMARTSPQHAFLIQFESVAIPSTARRRALSGVRSIHRRPTRPEFPQRIPKTQALRPSRTTFPGIPSCVMDFGLKHTPFNGAALSQNVCRRPRAPTASYDIQGCC
jgi:hypothetical protein